MTEVRPSAAARHAQSLSITITPAARSAASVLQQAGRVGRDPACPGLAVFFVSEASLDRLAYIPGGPNVSAAHHAHVNTYAAGVRRVMLSKRCLHQALMAEFDEPIAPCGDMCSVCLKFKHAVAFCLPSRAVAALHYAP